MRDLVFLVASIIVTLAIWQGLEIRKIYEDTTVPKHLLEKALPVDGRIDIEFLKSIENPAYE